MLQVHVLPLTNLVFQQIEDKGYGFHSDYGNPSLKPSTTIDLFRHFTGTLIGQ